MRFEVCKRNEHAIPVRLLRLSLPMMTWLLVVASVSTWAYPGYNTNPIAPDYTGMTNTAQQIAGKIQAGWNIGNTLEAIGGETAWGNPQVTQELIHLVKQNGFDAIRIPCSWNQYANQGTAEISSTWLNRVKQVVQYCVNEDMYVILNIHWDGGWLENNVTTSTQAANNAKQQAFWEQIATKLRDFDEHLLFASANEPNVSDATQMGVLMSYHQTFIDAVRSTGGRNAYRTLVVQGPNTDIERTYNLMNSMPVDTVANRMMLEIHYYTPLQFCGLTRDETWGSMFYYWGQGYHSMTDPARNSTWGEEAALDSLFSMMKTKFVDQGIPVVLGEFAATKRLSLTGDNLALHLASRAHFHDYVTERANANGMLPFYWDIGALGNNTSGIFNRWSNTVDDQDAVDALTLIDTAQYWTAHGDDYADPPAAPAGLSATGGDGLVELSWTASSGATGYKVSRNSTGGGTYSTIATNILSTNYTDFAVVNGTTYHYVVSAMNAGGESTSSTAAIAMPQVDSAGPASNPIPADGITEVDLSPNLGWTAGANADAHWVFFGYDSNTVATATTNSPEFKGGQAGNVYAPGALASSGRFFWRVDEAKNGLATIGPVWTFATSTSTSVLAGISIGGEILAGDTFDLSFQSGLGQAFCVEATHSLSDDPVVWTVVTNNVQGTGGLIHVQETDLPAQRYYRLILLNP